MTALTVGIPSAEAAMVQAWYMAPLTAEDDQRLPHRTDPLQELSLDQLKERTGCLYWKVGASFWERCFS